MNSEKRHKVIIIGGGLSGLSTAKKLLESPEYSTDDVLILEARNRVGGRTLSEPLGPDGVNFDLGGQWIGPHQRYVNELAEEFDLKQQFQKSEGKNIMDLDYNVTTYSGPLPSFSGNPVTDLFRLLSLNSTLKKLKAYEAEVDCESKGTCKNALQWDSISLEKWKQDNILFKGVSDIIDIMLRTSAGCEPKDTSLLNVVWSHKASGGIDKAISEEGGAQERFFVNGSQTLSEKLAESVGRERILLNTAVTEIDQSEGKASVYTRSTGTDGCSGVFFAERVVVAMHPCIAEKIRYSPLLPFWKQEALTRHSKASSIKVNILFKTPFWREKGFSGTVLSDGSNGPLQVCMDCSKVVKEKNGKEKIQGCLVGLTGGDPCRKWLLSSEEERKIACLKQISRWFCPDGENLNVEIAKQVSDELQCFVEKNWRDDEWSDGCYAIASTGYATSDAVMQGLSGGDSLRDRTGLIHWAGTETSVVNPGYMDGAIASGHRVALEILRC